MALVERENTHRSPVPVIAAAKAGDEFCLGVDLEMAKDVLGVAVDGLDTDAKVAGDLFPVPALAEEVEDGAVARVMRELRNLPTDLTSMERTIVPEPVAGSDPHPEDEEEE